MSHYSDQNSQTDVNVVKLGDELVRTTGQNDITRAKNDIKLGSRKIEIRGAHSERTFSKKLYRDISRKKILEYGQVLQSVQFYDGLERRKS